MNANCIFHKKGVAGVSSSDGLYCTIADAMDLADFGKFEPTILKMDVEGAEFEAIATCSDEDLSSFDQIALEVHWLHRLSDPVYRVNFERMLNALNSQFTLFHVHANNCAGVHIVSTFNEPSLGPIGGLTVGDVLELSYIRTDLVRTRSPNKTFYPTELDFPNSEHWPDHLLTFFPFIPGSDGFGREIARLIERNDILFAKTKQS